MRKQSIVFALLSIVFCLTACGGGGGSDTGGGGPTPGGSDRVLASVALFDGNSQTATVGTELVDPLLALLLNRAGSPIAGLVVNFRVVTGGGSVFAGAAISDNNGIVRERWTLGTVAGSQKVEVRAVDSSGAAVVFATFEATAVADAPTSVSVASGNSQSANQLQPLPSPVKVVIKDTYGNPVAGVGVVFTANNGGTALPGTAMTNAAGEAAASWTLGLAIGGQTLNAVVTGFPTVTFNATATEAPPSAAVAITKISGDLQTILQHHASAALTVHVTDVLGNDVPGESVAFSAVPASGYIEPVTIVTDADGLAGLRSYFHTSGQLQIVASVSGIPSVMFTVYVTPNAHLFDGKYTGDVEFQVSGGVLTLRYGLSCGGPVNETDGTITWNNCSTLTPVVHTGQIVIDSLQNATATGTWIRHDWLGNLTGSGTWSSARDRTCMVFPCF